MYPALQQTTGEKCGLASKSLEATKKFHIAGSQPVWGKLLHEARANRLGESIPVIFVANYMGRDFHEIRFRRGDQLLQSYKFGARIVVGL